jgi:uncharacterized NAD-dependent epimerase/dehydratase family protein
MNLAGSKLALYMEGGFEDGTAKLGMGVLRYSPFEVVAIVDSNHVGGSLSALSGIDRKVPIVGSVADAHTLGADVLIIGIANPGGFIAEDWWPSLNEALRLGLSLVNGMHEFFADQIPPTALVREGQFIWDVRRPPIEGRTGTGAALSLSARRVLMVGTDMSVGKMTAGLELHRAALAQGVKSSFVATGQTGIIITGSGVPLDAVKIDFGAGLIEQEVMACSNAELIVIEGQGSLLNPASSANLSLIRGSCPTHLVMCHRAGMENLRRFPWVTVPPLGDLCRLYEDLASACGAFPRPTTAGICLNTFGLSMEDAESECRVLESEVGLPVCDPIRHSVDQILARILA